MHGLIFFSLRRFVDDEFPRTKWKTLLRNAGLADKAYSLTSDYPDWELSALIEELRKHSSWDDILVRFGQFLAAELLELNCVSLEPDWTCLDVLLNVENAIHQVVRLANPGADPPVLKVQSRGKNQVQILYASPRRLCRLAKGLITGIARKFDAKVSVVEESCMLEDAPFCTLVVSLEEPGQPVMEEGNETRIRPVHGTKTVSGRGSGAGPHDSQFAFLPAARKPGELGRLGDYSLTRLLGKGSMGQVYEAVDERLHRDVAIKVLAPHLLGEEVARTRFINEARTMASLVHPRILTIFQVDEFEGIPYFVMPLLEGMTLHSWIECDSAVSTRRNIEYAIRISEGLQAAHERDVIHRDIKPENIWIGAKHQELLIMDFGLSLRVSDDRRLTRSGILVGTPMYMAPEQAVAAEIDHRTDIYSLGASLYHLFTGRPPFDAPSLTTLLLALANDNPPRAMSVKADFSHAMDSLLNQMMAKSPDDRPSLGTVVARLTTELDETDVA